MSGKKPVVKKEDRKRRLEEIIRRKEKIEKRLQKTGTPFHNAMQEASKRFTEAAQWKTKLDSFLYRHADNNGKVSEEHKAELEHLMEAAENAEKVKAMANERHLTLRNERIALRDEYSKLSFYATLDDVLEYQEDVARAEEKVADFQAKIQRQGEVIEKAGSLGGELIALNKEKEDLLASIETGDAGRKELKELDGKIAKATAAAAEKDKIIKEANQTILGLNRRLQDAEMALNHLKGQSEEILRLFLTTEAVEAYEEYIHLSAELDELYIQLMGLNELFSKYAKLPHPNGILAVPVRKMMIPAFNMLPRNFNMRVPTSGFLNAEIQRGEEVMEAERSRIRKMGVTII